MSAVVGANREELPFPRVGSCGRRHTHRRSLRDRTAERPLRRWASCSAGSPSAIPSWASSTSSTGRACELAAGLPGGSPWASAPRGGLPSQPERRGDEPEDEQHSPHAAVPANRGVDAVEWDGADPQQRGVVEVVTVAGRTGPLRPRELAYRVVLRLTHDPSSAEDAAQEAFVKALVELLDQSSARISLKAGRKPSYPGPEDPISSLTARSCASVADSSRWR